MQIYSGNTVDMALPASGPPPVVPDVISGRSDLDILFLQFARQVYLSATVSSTTAPDYFYDPSPTALKPDIKSGLCEMIYNGWLVNFVDCTTTSATYLSSVGTASNTASLVTLFRLVLRNFPTCRLYMLLGIHHFVIWYFITSASTAATLLSSIRNYIKQVIFLHQYYDSTLKQKTAWASSTFPSAFNTSFDAAFDPSNSLKVFELSMKDIKGYLKWEPSGPLLSISGSPQRNQAAQAALKDFIQKARESLNAVVDTEIKRLLEKVDLSLKLDYGTTQILALGGGEITYGFFGKHKCGILFFNYSFATGSSGTAPTGPLGYLGIQKQTSLEIFGSEASSIFVAHLGVDQFFTTSFSASSSFITRRPLMPHIRVEKTAIAGPPEREDLYVVHNGLSTFEPGGMGLIYSSAWSSISPVAPTESIKLSLFTNTSGLTEELAFFIMPNKVAAIPPVASAKATWQFSNNVFTLNSGAPVYNADTSDFDDLITELAVNANFNVIGTLRGDGIGTLGAGPGASGTTVVKSTEQKDHAGGLAGDNLMRQANGTTDFFVTPTGRELRFDIWGFASGLNCTWATNYPLGVSLYPRMYTAVGQYITDTDVNGGPWYNGALSSFRAFGLLIAMIAAIKAASFSRMSPARYAYVAGQLDEYLTTTAGVRIIQQNGAFVVTAAGPEVIINDLMFINVTTP